jgi:putative FmdB family regulatory protein
MVNLTGAEGFWMPTYEYRCNECGHELEAFQKITEPALKLCPNCNKEALERLISGGNFVLKGGDWGKDLYSSKGAQKTDAQQTDKLQSKIDESKKKAANNAA